MESNAKLDHEAPPSVDRRRPAVVAAYTLPAFCGSGSIHKARPGTLRFDHVEPPSVLAIRLTCGVEVWYAPLVPGLGSVVVPVITTAPEELSAIACGVPLQ